MKTKIIALFICVLGFMQNALSQTNLLRNGDFERSPADGSKVANGWYPDWYPNTAGAITTATAAKKGKGLWMYTGSGSSQAWIYQVVDCTSNRNYKASAFMRCPKQAGKWTKESEAYIIIEFQNSTGATISEPLISGRMSISNPEWREYSLQFRTPENAAKIIFTVKLTSENGQSILNVDDCSVVQTN